MKYSLNLSHSIRIVLPTLLLLMFAYGCGDSGYTGPNGNGDTTGFSSGSIASGETFSHTFESEGTVEYYCSIHEPDMQGSVTVSSGVQNSNPDTVEMENSQFNPEQITVAPNTQIVWINRDGFTHTVVEGNPSTGGNGGGGGY